MIVRVRPASSSLTREASAALSGLEAQLDLLFHQLVYPDKVAAIVVEPVIA